MITRKLREILNPYLIWESRVNLNAALSESCRFYTQIPLEKCLAHECLFLLDIYLSKVAKFHAQKDVNKQCEIALNIYSSYNDFRRCTLMAASPKVKNTNIDRLLYFRNKTFLLSQKVDKVIVNKLFSQCTTSILQLLHLKRISIPKNLKYEYIQIQ